VSPKISQEKIDEIKSKVSMLDVVGEDVVLRKVGRNFSGLCPFHSERSPSFTVNPEKGLYHCYGCKAGGDMITYLVNARGMTFTEALLELSERGGVKFSNEELGRLKLPSSPIQKKSKTAFRLNRFASKYFRETLKKNLEAKKYLEHRKISEKLQEEFYVGLSLDEWSGLAEFLENAKAPEDLAFELGLLHRSKKNDRNARGFDAFRNRIMFPILDASGKVLGFGGRILPGKSQTNENAPKYLNSQESFLFQKSRSLFGLFQAKKHIREQDTAIVVEGFFDVLGLASVEVSNAVATCGTALTSEHLKLLSRFSSRIILLYDGDRAGRDATESAMKTALKAGIILESAYFPDGVDPFDLAVSENGAEKINQLISQSLPEVDRKLNEIAKEGHGGDEAKSKAIKAGIDLITLIEDPVGRMVRTRSFAEKLGIEIRVFQQLLNSKNRDKTDTFRANSTGNGKSVARSNSTMPRGKSTVAGKQLSQSEVTLLRVLFSDFLEELLSQAVSYFPGDFNFEDLFESKLLKELTRHVKKTGFGSGQATARLEAALGWTSEFAELSGVPELANLIREYSIDEDVVLTKDQAKKYLGRALGEYWARFSQKVRAELANAEFGQDQAIQDALMRDYLDVQRRMKECKDFYAG